MMWRYIVLPCLDLNQRTIFGVAMGCWRKQKNGYGVVIETFTGLQRVCLGKGGGGVQQKTNLENGTTESILGNCKTETAIRHIHVFRTCALVVNNLL